MNVFSLTIHDSTQPYRKTIITTEVLSFVSVEKIINHFHLISFTGLTLRTETNDNHCKLEKTSALRPLGLLLPYTFKNMKVSVNVVLEIVTLRDQKKKKLKARQQNGILVPFRGSFQNLQQAFLSF